ncbi:MAG: hypothetical protein ABGZ23_01855 [Fuerstiella sp.]
MKNKTRRGSNRFILRSESDDLAGTFGGKKNLNNYGWQKRTVQAVERDVERQETVR